jgi:serine O-acetyltransferase
MNAARRILEQTREDLHAALERDPAATGIGEVLLYPHLHALWFHRLAHRLYLGGHRVSARAVALAGRHVSGGIDIHPGARIGRRLFIDHGCGVVIGETAEIGDDVTLYHHVTLGAVGWWKDVRRPPGEKRHPTVGDHVVVGANATVLGPITIGARTKICANALVLESVPPDSIVRVQASEVITAEERRRPRPAPLPEIPKAAER